MLSRCKPSRCSRAANRMRMNKSACSLTVWPHHVTPRTSGNNVRALPFTQTPNLCRCICPGRHTLIHFAGSSPYILRRRIGETLPPSLRSLTKGTLSLQCPSRSGLVPAIPRDSVNPPTSSSSTSMGARLLRAVHRPADLSETARRREELEREATRGIGFPSSVTGTCALRL